ncbi:hypothetical protein J6590_066656 [Homalodisca vitripennis]|nr:hypothetical protein J6590_066656 [Homalodisca vitripennis]
MEGRGLRQAYTDLTFLNINKEWSSRISVTMLSWLRLREGCWKMYRRHVPYILGALAFITPLKHKPHSLEWHIIEMTSFVIVYHFHGQRWRRNDPTFGFMHLVLFK